ncbi:MAG: glycosyl transferase family 1, partial [Dehalococcoidales bacterium]
MRKVETKPIKFEIYEGIVPDDQLIEATEIAEKLRGLHIVYINATPVGGGVAEILKSLVPMMQGVGVDAEWYAIEPDDSFFRVTKMLHHCLQGKSSYPVDKDIELYLAYNERAAKALADQTVSADLWIAHDVQVLPLLHYLKTASPGIWVCHIDTTEPNDWIRQVLLPYMNEYRMILFSMPEYHLDGLDSARVSIFPPAIDPLSIKNTAFPKQEARAKLARLGIDP